MSVETFQGFSTLLKEELQLGLHAVDLLLRGLFLIDLGLLEILNLLLFTT
jgi:hypothetical protein